MPHPREVGLSEFTQLLLGTATMGTIALMLWVAFGPIRGRSNPVEGMGFLAGLTLWAVAPYGLLAFVTHKTKAGPIQALILAVGTLVVVGFGGYAFVGTLFFFPPDPQAGLVFVFVPLFQIIVGVGIAALVGIVGFLTPSHW